MSVRLSCPSCNTAFALPALPDHRRATCPRCGDVFPIRTYTEEASAAAPVVDAPAKAEPRRRWPFVVGVAVVFGLVGLGVVIATRGTRETPPGQTSQELLPAQVASPPVQLSALGFLPADCNILFAVQPGPLILYAARTNQDPRDVLTQAGFPDAVRNALDQLGIPLVQIDHFAGGIKLGEGEDVLRMTLVLVLQQSLADEDEFLRQLKAKPVAGKKDRYDVVVGRFPLLLARVWPTVWAFGLDDKDFGAIETGAVGPGAGQFRAGMLTTLAAVPLDASVWVAADDDRDWAQKPIVKLAGQSPEVKKWLPVLKDGRGGLVAVSLDENPRLRVHVRAGDDATAARVRAYFAARAAEVETATSDGSGTRALFDAPFEAKASGKLLQRMLSDAGR